MLAIDGIASAELEGSEDSPLGVRVQLAAGADPASVGVEVERVLASHGMRSHRAEESSAAAEEAPAESDEPSTSPSVPGPPPPPGAAGEADATVFPIRSDVAETVTNRDVIRQSPDLESVSVEESRSGIAVRVAFGGKSVTRQVGKAPDGMDAAIVAAVIELMEQDAELVAVQRGEAGGAKIITVLLEIPGRGQQVGSAVVIAGDAYAVAHAAWKALTALE